MPPTDRFVTSFAAEPPQEGLPYGRWADTLREHLMATFDEMDTEGEQLGETVEALAAKTDVKARARERAEQLSQRLKDTTARVKEQAAARTTQARAHATVQAGLAGLAAAGVVVVVGVIVIRRRRRR